jgi:hypothetical protein
MGSAWLFHQCSLKGCHSTAGASSRGRVLPGTQDFILGYGIAALQAAWEDALRRTNHTAPAFYQFAPPQQHSPCSSATGGQAATKFLEICGVGADPLIGEIRRTGFASYRAEKIGLLIPGVSTLAVEYHPVGEITPRGGRKSVARSVTPGNREHEIPCTLNGCKSELADYAIAT